MSNCNAGRTSNLARAAAAAIMALFAAGCGDAENRVHQEIFERIYPFPPEGRVSIRVEDGSVMLYGALEDQVQVRALKRAYSRARLDQIEVRITREEASIDIDTILPAKSRWGFSDRSGKVDYEIIVPQEAVVSGLSVVNGVIAIEGMRGAPVKAALGSGKLYVRDCFADQEYHVTKGSADFIYDWWEPLAFVVKGRVEDGNVKAIIPEDGEVRINASSTHGKAVHNFGRTGRPYLGDAKSFELLVCDTQLATIELETGHGNIQVIELKY